MAHEAEQIFDERREDRVGAEEEDREDRGHDDDHDRGRNRLLAGRPMDALNRFQAHLPYEFAGGDSRHCFVRFFLSRIEKRPADLMGPAGLRVT